MEIGIFLASRLFEAQRDGPDVGEAPAIHCGVPAIVRFRTPVDASLTLDESWRTIVAL